MNEVKELVLTPLLAEARFVIIWLSTPIMLIGIYELLCLLVKREVNQVQLQSNSSETSARKPNSSFASSLAVIAFLIFLGFYIYLMFFKEDFAYDDNLQFTLKSLIGNPIPMPIWRNSGRFWPLGLQEYNFLAIIGKNFFVYQAFSVFQLLIVLVVINKIFSGFTIWYRLATMFVIMVTPSFVISFFGLIYPERNVIFWMSLLILCCHSLIKSENTNSRIYVYGALISAHFCLYYKETAFVLIGSFSGARLLQNSLVHRRYFGRSGYFIEFVKTNYVDFSLIILSILFLILYGIEVAPYVTTRYGLNLEGDSLSTFFSYIDNSFLLIFLILTLVSRAIYLVISKKIPNILWDSLLLAAVLYLLAFVKLNMYQKWYSAPTDFIAVLYFSQLIYDAFLEKGIKKSQGRLVGFTTLATMALLVLLVVNQNIQKSSYEVLLRKNIVFGNAQLAYEINQYSHQLVSSKIDFTTLFFPASTHPNKIANFAYFLKYKGIDLYSQNFGSGFPGSNWPATELKENDLLANLSGNSSQNNRTFILKSPSIFQKNLCVPYWEVQCFQVKSPNQGDLIVILPGINHTQEVIDIKAESKILFSYQQQSNFSAIEKILLAISRQDFSYMDVYILQKI